MFDTSAFTDLFNKPGVAERSAARDGRCPESRVCTDLDDLAGWFKSVAIAAGAIRKQPDVGS